MRRRENQRLEKRLEQLQAASADYRAKYEALSKEKSTLTAEIQSKTKELQSVETNTQKKLRKQVDGLTEEVAKREEQLQKNAVIIQGLKKEHEVAICDSLRLKSIATTVSAGDEGGFGGAAKASSRHEGTAS